MDSCLVKRSWNKLRIS